MASNLAIDVLARLLASCVRIWNGLPSSSECGCSGSGLLAFARGVHASNTFQITVRNAHGAVCEYIQTSDLSCTCIDESTDMPGQAQVYAQDVAAGMLRCVYTLADDIRARVIRLRVRVCGVVLLEATVPCVTFSGQTSGHTVVATHRLRDCVPMRDATVIAVNMAGSHAAIVRPCADCVDVYELPDFKFVHSLHSAGDGRTRLNHPVDACFGTNMLFVADHDKNARVSRWTLDAAHITNYDIVLSSGIRCIAAHGDLLAIGLNGLLLVVSLVHEAIQYRAVFAPWALPLDRLCFTSATTLVSIAGTNRENDWFPQDSVSSLSVHALGRSAIHQHVNAIQTRAIEHVPVDRRAPSRATGLATCTDGTVLMLNFCRRVSNKDPCISILSETETVLHEAPLTAFSKQIPHPISIAACKTSAYVLCSHPLDGCACVMELQ
jgi:hypothetical protein